MANSKTNSQNPKARPGNQNAKGNKGGGAPRSNANAVTHGLFATVFKNKLSEQEQKIFDAPIVDKSEIIENIRILKIRLLRLWRQLEDLQGSVQTIGDLKVGSVTTTKNKREFASPEEETLYHERIREKVDAGERLPGTSVEIATTMADTNDLILRYHAEIGRVQRDIAKLVEQLSTVEITNQRLALDQQRTLLAKENQTLDREKFEFKKRLAVYGIDLDNVFASDDPGLEHDR